MIFDLLTFNIFAASGSAAHWTIPPAIVNLAYLIAAILFIFGLKGLSHPKKAVKGNLTGAVGMLIAIVVTLLDRSIISYEWIIVGFVVGGLVGAILAQRIEMTSMPEMVGLLNGFGGIASLLVAGAALAEAALPEVKGADLQMSIATVFSGLIGSITFTGSIIAFGKLSGKITENAIVLPARHAINIIIAIVLITLAVMLVMDPSNTNLYWYIAIASGILGVLLVIPIGGADMPVVISLLNSYSGLAAAATGFVLNNTSLIITGSLVGASGLILTNIMCVAMNRSLANVIFTVFGPQEGGAAMTSDIYTGKVKSTTGEEVAMILDGVSRVVVVPGYGMAVSQAQHQVREIAQLLESKGTVVEFAIHPVAGRMPGHMNVLLAEANIDYDKLITMEDINPTMGEVDVCIIIGANDVVNPVAREDGNPISGMPIIDVDKARTCVVIKRSLSHGFAGIPNPLFAAPNTLMLFGDGKKALLEMIAGLKET